MPEIKHLPKAPIAEAIIDIRVKPNPTFDPDILLSLRETISDSYPHFVKGILVEFANGETIPEVRDHGFQAIKAESEDRLQVVQFRKDGFTFSRLRPYSTWDDLYQEASRLWEKYLADTKPEAISRLTVRYINHIAVEPGEDLDDYLTAGPQMPSNLPQSFGNFLINILVEDSTTDSLVNVTQTAETDVEDKFRVIVDVEAYKRVELDPETSSVGEILSQLREVKNRFFFSLVTEKTIARYL